MACGHAPGNCRRSNSVQKLQMPEPYNGKAMPERSALVIEYGAFLHPPSALFRDHVNGAAGARPFYDGGRWDLEAVAASGTRATQVPRDRARLARALARQQEERGAQAAAARARLLAEPETVAVVTGQQAGLFGGPLYVLYKAIAAVELAEALSAHLGRTVVPVFWVASDDHDFAEVRSTSILDESGQIHTLRYAPEREPSGQPAARIVLDDSITGLVSELVQALPSGPHRDEIGACVAGRYRPGATLAGAFERLLSCLLPELVVLDPSDAELKALMVPVLEREIAESSPTSRLSEGAGRALVEAGYHQQVPVRSGFLNLFMMHDGERRALALKDGGIEVRGTSKWLSMEEALRAVRERPADWSPGALLRPLAQDLLLPTAAYVGGPAEIAYHAQIGPSYAHFGIPRPVLVPRPSLTIVEAAQARALEAEGLTLAELQTDPEVLLARWAREAYPEVEAAFDRARVGLAAGMEGVEQTLGALDPTLRAAADSARGRALHQIETLQEKALRVLKKRDQARADRLRRTRDALLPGGSFQERGLGLIHLLARHGSPIVTEIRARMDVWAKGHQVIYL
jgi:bacillithiol biosynthesis cysteine-adding enzyme BshC